MNHTESGAIATGAPHSLARHATEASHALEWQLVLLRNTPEGRDILERFANTQGCNFRQMVEHEKENPTNVTEWIIKNERTLNSFLQGIQFAFSKS